MDLIFEKKKLEYFEIQLLTQKKLICMSFDFKLIVDIIFSFLSWKQSEAQVLLT